MGGDSSLFGSRKVLVASIFVFTFMIGSGLTVPWMFTDPYNHQYGDPRLYTVIEKSAIDDADNESVETLNTILETRTTIEVSIDELSPAGQDLLETILTDGTASSYKNLESTRHEVRFCDDAMPVCDEFGPPPDDFRTEMTVINADDSQYLLIEHRSSNDVHIRSLGDTGTIVVLVFFPALGLLAHQALFARERQPRIVVGVAAYGALLTIGGIADPFLYMFYDISLRQYSSALVGFTWLLIVAVAVAHRRNRSAKRDQTEVSDR